MSRLLRVVLVGLLVAVGLAGTAWVGWWLLTRHETVPPDTPLAEQCPTVPASARRTTLDAEDGTVLGAAVVGRRGARVGVLVRQGRGQTICEWLPWSAQVSEATGARVLLFDRRGLGSSPADGDLAAEPADTLVAVRRLRQDGASKVALVGSSMGNSVVFSALREIRPPPCAVVSVSPVLSFSDDDGTLDATALPGLAGPVWVVWESGDPAVVDDARRILRRARAAGPRPRLLRVDTDDHSLALVRSHPQVPDFLRRAIASC